MSLDDLFVKADRRAISLFDPGVVEVLEAVLSTEDVTFIIGSAVSLFPPASVVNGQRVTQEIAERLSNGLPKQDILRRYIAKAAFEVILQYNDNDAAIRSWLLKLFSSKDPKKPNSMHVALAESLARKPAYVVTTNYDCFIERALEEAIVPFDKIINSVDAASAHSAIRYFKIHGCTSDPSSLVYKLDQERPLQGWKAQTFRALIGGRVVIVIGYSGKDFEICPALMENKPKAILWNALELNIDQKGFPSENAEHLYKNVSNMLFMTGDMHDIFRKPRQRPSNVNEEILRELFDAMTPVSVAKWRAAVLDVIGAPRQVKSILKESGRSFDDGSRHERLGSVAYGRGKYATAIYHGIRRACVRSRGEGWPGFALRAGLDAAFKLRNRGNRRMAKLAYNIASVGWRRSGFALRREYAMNMAWFEILDLYRFARKADRLRKRIEQMESISLQQGFWGSYYLVRDVAEEIRYDVQPRTRKQPPIMPSQLGFKHIGNIPGQTDAFMRGLRTGASWSRVEEEIDLAVATGLHPERWKCALAALEAGGWSMWQDLRLVGHLFGGLRRCQYTVPSTIKIVWKTARLLWVNRKRTPTATP